jgi:hypothetical protein
METDKYSPEAGSVEAFRESAVAPHFALIAAQIIFGTWPMFGKIVLRAIPATGLAALRVGNGYWEFRWQRAVLFTWSIHFAQVFRRNHFR